MLRGSHGDVAGDRVGLPPPSSDQQVNTGTVPGLPGDHVGQRGLPGWAHRRPIGPGWGGAAVVVRSASGRAGHMAKGGSGIEKGWRL